jgi:hypothetical protein
VTNPVITLSLATGSVHSLAAGGLSIQVSSPTGITYVILTSSNLFNWTPMVTNVTVTGSEAVSDTSATNCPARFYRVLVQ